MAKQQVSKMRRLEEELDVEKVQLSEIDFECKMDHFRRAGALAVESKAAVLAGAGRLMPKLDNQSFQAMILLQKVDEAISRAEKLRKDRV